MLTPSSIAGPAVHVTGDANLDATLNVEQPSGVDFDPGIYQVIAYDGTLTGNGLALGSTPAGTSLYIQTSIAGAVNLVNSTGIAVNFWDTGTPNSSSITGGSGVWQAGTGNDNWTSADGALNTGSSAAQMAIFSGQAGTVTVDNSRGNVSTAGMQFASDGYVIDGDALTLTETVPASGMAKIIVGNHAAAGASYTATINAVLQGSSGLEKSDLGTLVLTGANTYTGGTLIDGGTLAIERDANLGTAAGGLTLNGGALRWNDSFNIDNTRAISIGVDGGTFDLNGKRTTISQAVTGTGDLKIMGGGALTLTAANTYTGTTSIATATTLELTGAGSIATSSSVMNDGTFDISGTSAGATITNLSGNGAVALGARDLTLAQADGIYAGSFTGSGSLIKRGSGSLYLNGDSSSFNGMTRVAEGVLEVGDIDHASAVLGGNATIANAATLRGHGTILGNVTSDGTVAPGGSIGTLTINGNYTQSSTGILSVEVSPTEASQLRVGGSASLAGGLSVVYDPGTYSAKSYTLLHAGEGVTGTFGSVNSTGQESLGDLTASVTYGTNDVNLVLAEPATTGPADTTVVAPKGTSIYTAVGTTALLGAQSVGDALLSRLDGSSRRPGQQAASAMRNAAIGAPSYANGAWATLTGTHTRVSGSNGAPGYQENRYGVLAGLDHQLGDYTLGVAIGADHNDIKERETGNSGQVDSLHLAAYGSRDAGPVKLAAMIGGGVDWLSQKRPFDAIGTAKGDHTGGHFFTGLQASLPLQIGGSTVTPKAGLRYAWFHSGRFGEHGANGQDLDVSADTARSLQPYAGVTLDHRFEGQRPIDLQLRVAYAQELLATGRSVDVTSQDGTMFAAPGARQPRGYLNAGMSLGMQVGKSTTVSLGYDAMFNTGRMRAQQGVVEVDYRF